jgi:hypothetical protein
MREKLLQLSIERIPKHLRIWYWRNWEHFRHHIVRLVFFNSVSIVGKCGCLSIGSLLGYLANVYQERLYKFVMNSLKRKPRLIIDLENTSTAKAKKLVFTWLA